MTEEITENELSEVTLDLSELSTLQNYIQQYNSGSGICDISLKDLHSMLRNPYANIQRIQNTARYFSNRFGIVKDVNEAFKTLPTLNYHIVWSDYGNPSKITKYEKKIYDLLDTFNVTKLVRDGLGEQAEVGTVVAVNRKNKFIQFMELDKLRIAKQVNGRWIVEVDLDTISGNTTEILSQIETLPEEVTLEKYNLYRKKRTETNRYIPIKNAYVHSIRGKRNFPFGFPYTMSAWTTMLHKSLIEQVEKSVADRKIKSLLILYAQSIAKKDEGFKPPNKDVVKHYFDNLTNLIKKKDQGSKSGSDTVGTGVITLPAFFDLKEVEIDTEMFSKELYEKLEKDVFANLGVSSALIYGGGSNSNYGSAQMNSEKFFRYIYSALEDWESMINDIIKSVLPTDLNCRFYFDRTTISDKDKDISAKKEFYMQTSIWVPWAEAVLGVPYNYALGLAEYQDKVLKINEIIRPPANAYTQSGNEGAGRPQTSLTDSTENTIKSKGNNGNSNPSPSD